MLGVGFALGAALCWGASTVVIGRAVSMASPLMVGFISLVAGLALIASVTAVAEVVSPTLHEASMSGAPAVIASALLMFVIGRLAFYTSIREIGPSQSAALSATTTVIAAVIAVTVLGEHLSFVGWGGVILTAGGVAIVVTGRS